MDVDDERFQLTRSTDALGLSAEFRYDARGNLTRLTDEVVFFYSNGATIVGKDAFSAACVTLNCPFSKGIHVSV